MISKFITILLAASIISSCASFPEQAHKTACDLSPENIESFTDGFCGENIYRIKAEGVPDKGEKTPEARKEQALKRAVRNAKYVMLEKFQDKCIERMPAHFTQFWIPEELINRWLGELEEKIKNGRAVIIKWDLRQNCIIIYEVKMKDVKSRSNRCF